MNRKDDTMSMNTQHTMPRPEFLKELRLVGTGEDIEFEFDESQLTATSLRALRAVEDTSRRIDDLAKRLGCLGHFDRADGPRAA